MWVWYSVLHATPVWILYNKKLLDICRKLWILEKLTIFLVLALAPTETLRGAQDLSWLKHSSLSGLWRTWLFRVWCSVDFETVPHCNNITTTIRTGSFSAWPNRLGQDGLNGGRGKENKRLRSTAGEVKSPLSVQFYRGAQKRLHVWVFFWEDGDYDLVEYPSKGVLSRPAACH